MLQIEWGREYEYETLSGTYYLPSFKLTYQTTTNSMVYGAITWFELIKQQHTTTRWYGTKPY